MSFVIIGKNANSVPSNNDIREAMTEVGGAVASITGNNESKRVDFTGDVNHTNFENELIKVAHGRRTSWSFAWADEGDDAGTGAVNRPLGATNYGVTITMSPDTVTKLIDGGYSLYGFKAVQTQIKGGVPVVWFRNQTYSASTSVKWSVQYQAYTASSEAIANGTVTSSFATDIDLGQTLNVVAGGTGSVTAGGQPIAVSILNTTSTPFTCGIAQAQAGGQSNPMCAFPLYGNQLDAIAPIEKVLLLFASDTVNTGTVVYKAYSQGILVDLTSANQRAVTFDINDGWSWGGYNWAQTVKPSSDLLPLLIETPQPEASSLPGYRSLVTI